MALKTPASPRKRRGTKQSGKYVTKVDTSQARSNIEVLRICLQELGWKECISGCSIDSDIYWHSAIFQEGNRNFGFTSARVNKFPGMCDLLRKTSLTRSLNVMRTLFPEELDFYPKTWFLPEQNEQFQKDASSMHDEDRRRKRPLATFIVKPSDGSQGEGIYLIRDPARYNATNRPHVIQKYIDRPLLIDGLKFDIRIYVLILNLDPLEIFLYNEGLVRFATVDYQPPSATNLHLTFMHLTNYSLNKRSANYKHASDEDQINASKRKLTLVWSQLSQQFSLNEVERAKLLIEEMINKTILAILPEIRIEYVSELPLTRKQDRCFQIIGFDVILTDQLKPILLEVNANPSLRIDFDHENEAGKFISQPSPIDEEIKKPLVLETLKLVMRRRNQLEASIEIIDPEDENIVQNRVEEYNETESRNADKIHTETQSKGMLQNTTPMKKVVPNLTNTVEESQDFNEDTISEAVSVDKFMNTITSNKSVIQSQMSRILRVTHTPIVTSVKSLKMIHPTTSPNKYENMFLLEKIAFIYIELVIRRGYKTMTNRQFRHFARISGVIDSSITMPSIDMLYAQIFYKWKSFVVKPSTNGLHFPAFIEALLLLVQRKYSSSGTLLSSVIELIESCVRQLDFCVEV
ncbi:unnamed protein product [Rotaria magnacalcarata]|uniref:Tubulin polyglutamylase TTLL11 n=3 Tax=Rotaria magnacalcarata TaxID=392030 RepID=A0A816YJ57_9BILA|nr:unnamed protein product [Rotaria magnacalcarata]